MGWGGWRMLIAWLRGRRPGPAPFWEAGEPLEAEVWAQLSDRSR
jgi:hypothetical protein